MTTLAAAKKGKKICIGSDSLTLFGTRKEVSGKHVKNESKIINIGSNLVGISGHASWSLILTDYFSKKKAKPLWRNPNEIFEIFNEFHFELKSKYYLTPPNLNFTPFESSELQLLIVNVHGIFEVGYNRIVREYIHFSAIGTGEEYALGAIRSIYDLVKDPEEIVKLGIMAASEFDQKTSAPVHLHCIHLK